MAKQKAEKPEKKSTYGAKDIFVLEGLEPVRKRPGMYIGTTGVDGLHHLIWEVVNNSVDEAMAGYARNVVVELLPDTVVAIADDGRGIPVEVHPQTKKSTLETVMTTLHAGGKFGSEAYKVSGGLHGVGVSVVNALSTWLRVEVSKDGELFMQEYERGIAKNKVKKIGRSERNGTTVIFQADPKIFPVIEYNERKIVEYLRQQAYLTKGIRIIFSDKRGESPVYHGFCFEGGLASFVKFLSRDQKALQDDLFYVHKNYEKLEAEVAFTFVDDIDAKELSFANNIYTPDGGTHSTGFRSALTRSLNTYARAEGYLKEKDENLASEDTREGLVAVISVKLPDPQFEGQTKSRLGSTEARTAVEAVVNEALKEFFDKHPQDARRIVDKVMLAAKARRAAKAAKDSVLRKGALEGLTLPGLLADCTSRSAEESELFIVEGPSAGGSAKGGRDRRTQAILPLRGKVLNVEKARLDKMLANNEIRALVIALGTAIGSEFNIEKIRYHKIVIMADADVDGAHIRTLLLTLFYRHFRKVIESGYLYIAQPPLFRVQQGKEIRYAYNEPQKEQVIAEMQKQKQERVKAKAGTKPKKKEEAAELEESAGEQEIKGVSIQRYKGLGEMNPEQLWETTLNPENRVLLQVTIDDAAMADHLFSVLMGDDVDPRKKFIQTQALAVKNLDI